MNIHHEPRKKKTHFYSLDKELQHDHSIRKLRLKYFLFYQEMLFFSKVKNETREKKTKKNYQGASDPYQKLALRQNNCDIAITFLFFIVLPCYYFCVLCA